MSFDYVISSHKKKNRSIPCTNHGILIVTNHLAANLILNSNMSLSFFFPSFQYPEPYWKAEKNWRQSKFNLKSIHDVIISSNWKILCNQGRISQVWNRTYPLFLIDRMQVFRAGRFGSLFNLKMLYTIHRTDTEFMHFVLYFTLVVNIKHHQQTHQLRCRRDRLTLERGTLWIS